jgi:membrane fusion protein (multidrug efflux system)
MSQTDTGAITVSPESPRGKPLSGWQRNRLFLLTSVPILVIVGSLILYLNGGRYVDTDNAYLKADKVPLSTQVSGIVKEVLVGENETVAAGQPLFRIDPAPFLVAVAKAEAKVNQVRVDLAALKANYREKQAEIQLARTRHDFALKDHQRQADLAARHFISPSRLDESRQGSDLAAQQTTVLQEDLKRIAETLGGSADRPIDQHPSYLAALAELDQAKLDLAHTLVQVPLAGTVSKPPKPGQYITAGTTAMALVASGDVWVEANFVETDLTHVRIGQSAVLRIDTYPGQQWQGVVDSLSPATGAEFSVIPAQNASGNWVKIAQRIPVRIRLTSALKDLPPLRAGLSAWVEIDTGHRRQLFASSH